MMPRFRPLFVLAVPAFALIGTFARPAAGQEITSPYRYVDESQSAGVFGGNIWTDRGPFELGPASGPFGGGRYSLRVSGPFTVEGEAMLFPTSRAVLDTARVDGGHLRVRDADLSILYLGASLRFNLTGPRTFYNLMPYFLFGGGGAFEVAEEEDANADLIPQAIFDFGTTFAGHLGAGVEWFLTRRLTLRLDARDILWKLDNPPAFAAQVGTPEDVEVAESQWVQNFVISLGIGYRF